MVNGAGAIPPHNLSKSWESEMLVRDVVCPKCGAAEMHPNGEWCLIRSFKVHDGRRWWSQCLVCAGYYDKELQPAAVWDRKKGWFSEA